MADLPGPTSCICRSSPGPELYNTIHIFQNAEGKEELQERFIGCWGDRLLPRMGALPSCLNSPCLQSWQLALLCHFSWEPARCCQSATALCPQAAVLLQHWCCKPGRSTAHTAVWQLKGLVINSEVPSNILVTNSNLHFYFSLTNEIILSLTVSGYWLALEPSKRKRCKFTFSSSLGDQVVNDGLWSSPFLFMNA